MATRGVKPKAAHLRLVDGTHRTTRHGDAGEVRDQIEQSVSKFGKLSKPKGLKARVAKVWTRYIEPAFWLDGAREPAAIAFCELWSEFSASPGNFPASKHGQMRAYMAELGLTDERNRVAGTEKPKDEFFD